MKRKIKPILVGALVSIMLCSTALAASFPDVDELTDYADAVDYLSEVGIMVGDDLGNFNPNKPVTRAEMATIICRMSGETDALKASNNFFDVPTSHWANKYISKAVELGVVNGYGDGKFGPSDFVTYEQAITMLVRSVGLDGDAQFFGGYPQGYIDVANHYGFTRDLTITVGSHMNRSDVAIAVFNVLVP